MAEESNPHPEGVITVFKTACRPRSETIRFGAPGRTRTCTTRFRRPVLFLLSFGRVLEYRVRFELTLAFPHQIKSLLPSTTRAPVHFGCGGWDRTTGLTIIGRLLYR